MDIRQLATDTANGWEKHAHSETYIDLLHPKAKQWLIEYIEDALRASSGASNGASTRASKGQVENSANTGVSASQKADKGQLKGQKQGTSKGK